jgi:hypothetical protein
LETRNHIQDGLARGYFTERDASELQKLQERATGAATRLLKYLERCKCRAPTNPEP